MSTAKILAVILFGFALLSAACASTPSAGKPENITAPAPVRSESPSQAKEDWQIKWDSLLAAARKEGKVIYYSSAGQSVRDNVARGFQKATGIEVEITTGAMPELAAKIFAEHRAGLYLADILTGGVTTSITRLKPGGVLQPIEPAFILPELTDAALIKKTWMDESLPWIDPEIKLIFVGPP